MVDTEVQDGLFREAVTAMDEGDLQRLEGLLTDHPEVVRDRLEIPGPWLRDKVGDALDGFFKKPYLLWFLAEDPVRNGTLPDNIVQVTLKILAVAQRERLSNLREQLDYGLRLVAWSWIAKHQGVQIGLIDTLMDAGASPEGCPDNALVNGNVDAARHLVKRGATLTLSTALCLEQWEDVRRLAPSADAAERQFGFVLAALNGKAEALRTMIDVGVELNAPSTGLFSHATPIHHAVGSGSLEAVRVLAEAGADVTIRDTVWNGTPLGWAEHLRREHERNERGTRFADIAEYLEHLGDTNEDT